MSVPVMNDRMIEISRRFLETVAANYPTRDFAVRFWDGQIWEAESGVPTRFTLILQNPTAVRRMFLPPDGVSFAEAYTFNDFDIEGDIHAFMRFVGFMAALKPGVGEIVRQAFRLFSLPLKGSAPRLGHSPVKLRGRKRSLERDREAIGYHYDLSNDFFALWLDREMLYSCAYFKNADDDLETAQRQKLDHICRKLRLQPGNRFLDIGCGWGALVRHAARHYGAFSVGITLSQRQAELCNERIRVEGLQELCRVEYGDYRTLQDAQGFDRIASVGMIEHLGNKMLPVYFRAAHRLLRPGGAFLNHAITLRANTPYPRWTAFARRYVFPDGELTTLTTTVREAENAGFEVRDVESLREHYALTLGHWVSRLEARHEAVAKLMSEATYRVFRLYLAGAKRGMETGVYNLHQTLLVKPDEGKSGFPLTRADWYRD